MKTKIEPDKFDLVLSVAIRHAKWISRIGVDIDTNGKISTPLVTPLTTISHEDFFGEVEKLWLACMKRYNNEKTIAYDGRQMSFKLYNLLWGRMCVTAYFFYHDDPFWKNIALREMRELNDIPPIQEDLNIAIQKIDTYYEKIARIKLTTQLSAINEVEEQTTSVNTQQSTRIAELEKLLSLKDDEISKLKAYITELESQLNIEHLSFIQTDGKHPDVIKCAYRDIKKATVGAAEMATCIHNLQVEGMLKNQEKYGKLKRIKKIYNEMQEVYHFEWTYDALRRALIRVTKKK